MDSIKESEDLEASKRIMIKHMCDVMLFRMQQALGSITSRKTGIHKAFSVLTQIGMQLITTWVYNRVQEAREQEQRERE